MILLAIALAALPRPNIVLVTIDTLRVDHVGSYGAAPGSTPALDALASEGLRFENAISPVPLTRPAHASLLTGLYPPEHGIRDNLPAKLDSSIPTLATRLQAAGYHTAAFVGSFLLGRGSGLETGFDVFGDGTIRRHRRSDRLHGGAAGGRGRRGSARVSLDRARSVLPLGPLLRSPCALRPARGVRRQRLPGRDRLHRFAGGATRRRIAQPGAPRLHARGRDRGPRRGARRPRGRRARRPGVRGDPPRAAHRSRTRDCRGPSRARAGEPRRRRTVSSRGVVPGAGQRESPSTSSPTMETFISAGRRFAASARVR